uniref:DNA excision repair protein ERCC-6 n=1 Tax=Lingulaulax polyedra TaxID=160621 RepID=A0A516AFX5_LINPO|nr:DNA excision repair protein ERCC-6 [Lingulodinium polyedra]
MGAPPAEAAARLAAAWPPAARGDAAGPWAPAPAGPAAPALRLPKRLHEHLRGYQREGVAWMWRLYHARAGGVLADDMGLGKTVQSCGFLRAVRAAGATHFLVLVPVTLMDQWAKEVRKWCPDCPVYVYHGAAGQRARALRAAMRPSGGVLLTSYAIVKNEDHGLTHVTVSEPAPDPSRCSWLGKRPREEDAADGRAAQPASKGQVEEREKPWDVVICDEAHVMRTISTLLGKSLRRVRANCRILLTGTPVQNALQDLWALMDFAQPGLLGNHATFSKRFGDPIEKGSVRGASPSAVALKRHLCEQLGQFVAPHLLRRTKRDVGLLAPEDAHPAAEEGQLVPFSTPLNNVLVSPAVESTLPPKVELVVWLLPTAEQVLTYQKALETSEVIREANSKTRLGVEVFRAIGLLKGLCNHPALGLPTSRPGVWREYLAKPAEGLMDARQLGRMEGPCRPARAEGAADQAEPEDLQAEGADAGGAVERLLRGLPSDAAAVVAQSAKLRCLAALLPALAARGHRTLIFSQGVKMMDLVEICVLKRQGIGYLRIDGQTDVTTRAERVESFQTQRERYQCMLLTTRVGGYGLNLTGADRVVLLDPAWNPATDMQAVERAYRIGQEREVLTYRLVMSGLIEDKMFRLQVFKMGLTKTALETRQQHRYFAADEIRGLFEWTDPALGETRRLLVEKHGDEDGEAADRAARCDGSHEGWLEAGPALGLSSFSALYSTLAQEQEELQEGGCAEELREMRHKLGEAERKAQGAAEARQAVETSLEAAQGGIEAAVQQLSTAAEAKSKAAERLKQAQHELVQARRQETAAERLLEKAAQAQAQAQRQLPSAAEGRQAAGEAAADAEHQAAQAGETLGPAEQALQRALEDVDSASSSVSSASNARGSSGGEEGIVGAPAGAVNAMKRAFERACKAFDAAQAGRAAAPRALAEAIKAEARHKECEADVAIAAKHAEPSEEAQCKALQAALKAAEKEAAKAEKAAERAAERAASSQEQAAQAVSDLREAAASLADALYGLGEGTLQRHVKAAQQRLKASARGLGTAWQAVRAAHEARTKAEGLHRKAARAATTAVLACKEAEGRAAAAGREQARAAEEAGASRARRASCEAEVEGARAACAAAGEQEAGQKRRREELREALSEAKQRLKSARVAEREATAGREALYKHYARTGDGAKEEVAVSRASAEEQQKAIEALQALRDEEYDANQVVEAYESKRKPRPEGE